MSFQKPLRNRQMWYLQDDSILYRLPEGELCSPITKSNVGELCSPKIAAFDLVNTLIWTDRGDYTIRGPGTWIWRTEEIPEYLDWLLEEGWMVVIFSNYISKNLEELQDRVEEMLASLRCCSTSITGSPEKPILFFASLKSDSNKKPNTGMWDLFLSLYPDLQVNREESFYVGDRAGDPEAEDPMFRKGAISNEKTPKYIQLTPEEKALPYKGDDSLFAYRIGLRFFLPSELPGSEGKSVSLPEEQELLILVGQQGSGKTTLASRVAQEGGYSLVASEENTLFPETYVAKDKKKRLRMVKSLLEEGKSVIVDATHPSKASREELIQIATSLDIPSRILWVARPGRPYNEIRTEKKVPEIALRTYTRLFERPTEEEAEVIRVL